MATRGGLPNVSYGIGVQNRYSAFLDDEDGFGPLTIAAPALNSIKIRSLDNSVKPKNSTTVVQKSATSGAKTNGRSGVASNAVKQQEAQDKGTAQNNGQRLTKEGDNRRPQQQQQQPQQQRRVGNNQVPRQGFVNGRQGNSDREGGNAANNRSIRYQSNRNSNHQSNASHQQTKDDNEAGQHQGRPQRSSNQRFNNRSRQFHTEDKRGGHQQPQEGQVDGVGSIGTQSNEEEKRRRQQKRALDLRFKDPEKREARRQQQSSNVATEQSGVSDYQTDQAQGDKTFGQRAQRNRRDVDGKPDEAGRTFNGPRNRNRRQEGDQDGGEQQRDGQQNRTGQRDRLPRTRSGFGAGSRNSRSGDDKNQERQKPIPNFSDKSDFPSLVSQ